MTAYTIISSSPVPGIGIGVTVNSHADRNVANDYLRHYPACVYGWVVDDADGNEHLTNRVLVGLYNAISGSKVRRFESRAVGRERLLSAVAEAATPSGGATVTPITSVEEIPIVTVLVSLTEAPTPSVVISSVEDLDAYFETTPDDAAPNVTRGRAPFYAREMIVTILVTENPKKPSKNNHARFAALMALPAPVTVGAAYAAGVTLGDLKYNVAHGYVSIDAP